MLLALLELDEFLSVTQASLSAVHDGVCAFFSPRPFFPASHLAETKMVYSHACLFAALSCSLFGTVVLAANKGLRPLQPIQWQGFIESFCSSGKEQES